MMDSMAGKADKRPDPILEAAGDWLLRLQAQPRDLALRHALRDWLAEDPRHAEAWAKVQRAWGRLGELAPQPAPSPAARPRRACLPRRIGWSLAAAAAACFLLLMLPMLLLRLEADYRTDIAESRDLLLEDGSHIVLGADSAIALDYGEGRRGVRLLAGQAFFEVTPDSTRPFTVQAGEVRVAVVGTAFDVRLAEATVTVAVQSGEVVVRHQGAGREARLLPEDQLIVGRADGSLAWEKVPSDAIAAWQDGHLFVNGATVAETVEALARYHPAWIVIADEELAQRRVVGLYDLREPDRALRALAEPYGGEVRAVTPLLRVLSLP